MDFDLANFLTWYIALIVAMVVHEGSHALVALLGGDRTAYETGQVTLNPIPHMQREPFGMVVLPLITYAMMGWPLGFAHAPYSVDWANRHPKKAALMAFAGPAANLLLVVLLFGFMKLGVSAGWFEYPWPRPQFPILEKLEKLIVARDALNEGAFFALARISSVMLSINLILGIFNLLPIPPLDGAGIAEGLLPGPLGNLFRILRSHWAFVILGIIIAWKVAGAVILPALDLLTRLLWS